MSEINGLAIWSNQDKLAEVKKLFAPTATNDEFQILVGIGKATGLNPYLREIYAVKYGNGPASIFVGRDGYRKSAQASKDYDWHFVETIRENDHFSVKNGEVDHQFTMKDRGKIVGAYGLCQRKGSSRPNYNRIDMSEYNTGKSVWSSKPSTMIKKVAEAQVLRMTFQELFSGTYDESEQWEEEPQKKPAEKAKPQTQEKKAEVPKSTPEQFFSTFYNKILECETIAHVNKYAETFEARLKDRKDCNQMTNDIAQIRQLIEDMKSSLSAKQENEVSEGEVEVEVQSEVKTTQVTPQVQQITPASIPTIPVVEEKKQERIETAKTVVNKVLQKNEETRETEMVEILTNPKEKENIAYPPEWDTAHPDYGEANAPATWNP